MILIGDTFLIPTPPDYKKEHLFIIIAANKANGEWLMVNIATLKDNCDNSCIIKKGSHPFIKRDSYVKYSEAIITDTQTIKILLHKKQISPHAAISQALLRKILMGARITNAISKKHLDFISRT